MKKKLSMILALSLALVLLTAGALAATGVIFSGRVDAANLADAALEDAYGITLPMQTYFHRSIKEDGNKATVQYKPVESSAFGYVLGEYTVTVENGKAKAAWSWDGTPVVEGFDAAPWGAKQLQEMIEENRETHSYQKYYEQAIALSEAAGIKPERIPYAPPTPEQIEARDKEAREVRARAEERMQFTRDELAEMGRAALVQHYGMTEEMLPFLTNIVENDNYMTLSEDKFCLSLWFGFGTNEADGTYVVDVHPEWLHLDGVYTVTVNVETGVIEDIFYDSALSGNG